MELSFNSGRFVSYNDRLNYQEVLNDFSNANVVRIITYNISKNQRTDALLDALKQSTADIKLITNVPSRMDEYYSGPAGQNMRSAARRNIQIYISKLNPDNFPSQFVPFFNVNNHAKLIGTEKRQFEKIIVYRLDRFSRDKYDPAIYKKQLLKNGVSVVSATENIPDNSFGIIIEALINGTNASYSVELAEKVKRNMDLNADKCLSNGGYTPLGYKLERINPKEEKSKKRIVINEETAPIVQEIFTKYANGWRIKDICDSLNERQIKTSHAERKTKFWGVQV